MISHGVMDLTFAAAADLSTKQFHFVKITADRTVNSAGAGEMAVGVLQDAPSAAAQAANVRMLGTTEIVAGAAFAAGVRLKANASGRAIEAATANDDFYAIALEAATADGDVVEAFLAGGQL